ncbi:serine protease [Lichenihabitans sp. PAMC28606]|uniref:S1C family serine protease n=1 Tax=Lichenihabitans sp. PAMC28606 TaxID=2880932 RepID=UPI001D0A6259|nr:serine protease [Lichenihabitans sp. PAMC28606]UDL94692.1 serine protease [Lichenihabitans sp. PAMC28606]
MMMLIPVKRLCPMRTFCVWVHLLGMALAPLLFIPARPAAAQEIVSQGKRPFLQDATRAFNGLSANDQVLTHIYLTATGDFNAMFSPRFGGRLYDSVVKFQSNRGLPQNGVMTSELFSTLQTVAFPILSGWGIRFVNHPTYAGNLLVPSGFGLIQTSTPHGLAFENNNSTLSVDFSFYSRDQVSLADLFTRLGQDSPERHYTYRVIKSDFFVVTGWTGGSGIYSRYIAAPGGSLGFTLRWDKAVVPLGNRIATLMANMMFLGYDNSQPNVAAVSQAPASLPQAAPSPPQVYPSPGQSTLPQTAALEPPKDAAPTSNTIVTGSAFFVSSDGALITNNHVIKGCSSAVVIGRGAATISATDARNDLALLRLMTKPSDPMGVKPVAFRSTPTELGETVFALGFPYAGTLDNGVNFTNGMVSSLSGMNNDSTEFQMNAAVQPGNSGGPVLDQGGNLLGITVARMSDLASLKATGSIPQNVNFGIKAEVAASFLRANGVIPVMVTTSAPVLTTQVASAGKAITAQVVCSSASAGQE